MVLKYGLKKRAQALFLLTDIPEKLVYPKTKSGTSIFSFLLKKFYSEFQKDGIRL